MNVSERSAQPFRKMVMDPLLAINSGTTLSGISASSAVTPSFRVLATELSLFAPDVFNNSSTVVALSGMGQLLSAVATFQDQVQSLQPGTPTSGGGQNFGTDFASLAAETQSLVDSFNGLQSNIANISATSNLLGGSVSNASSLVQSLNAQAQAVYTNGDSTLTSLSQLGINFVPSTTPGEGGTLSIDLSKLQSAFNTDATGAFSLLSEAANAFNDLAGNFVSEGDNQSASLALLAQTALLGNSFFGATSQTQTGDIFNLLTTGTLTPARVALAISEFTTVSGILG